MQAIKSILPKELMEGITGYYAHGESITFGWVEIKKGTQMPAHRHIHEQITFIVEGQLDMQIDGQAVSLSKGMFHIIPSNCLHEAFAQTDVQVIDVFCPVRSEYRNS